MLENNGALVVPKRLALLGATGNTGRLVLQKLLAYDKPDLKLQIYVRSAKKLESLFPSLASNRQVTVFEGSIQNEVLLRECISGCSMIICTLGENENIPGVRVLQDFARSTLKALEFLKTETTQWIPPRLILLSSATWNTKFAATRPAFLDWMIRNAFARPYSDLVTASEMLQTSPSLLSVLLVQPNALVKEKASGCEISTDFVYIAVSYEDLADGFVQLALLPEYATINSIGVSSRNAKDEWKYIPFVLGKVLRGLLFQYIPGYWQAEYAFSDFLVRLMPRKGISE